LLRQERGEMTGMLRLHDRLAGRIGRQLLGGVGPERLVHVVAPGAIVA